MAPNVYVDKDRWGDGGGGERMDEEREGRRMR